MRQFLTCFSALLSLLSIAPLPVISAPVNGTSLEKRAPTWGFPYGSTKVRGVNLGGWLVLEPWMTPTLFTTPNDVRIVDEYTFCQYQDYDVAHAALVNHWNTWITYDDFVKIKNAGLNHVRLPIGYWAWDVSRGEPYHSGQLYYLEQAVTWAKQTGLKVMIDLHGAPGSQNPFDNSGRVNNSPQWHTDKSNVARSLSIIRTIASWYATRTDVVTAIQSLNEPAGWLGNDFMTVLKQYWYDSYGNIRYPYGTGEQGGALQVIHDAFMGLDYWKGFMGAGFDGVMLDTHYYGIYDDTRARWSWDQQIAGACAQAAALRSSSLWTIVGEWTTAATDCAAQAFNGPNSKSRYDGSLPGTTPIGSCVPWTGSGSTFSQEYKTFLRKFFEAQTFAFEAGAGWIYWSWKLEKSDEWSYSKGLEYGWIPQDPTQRLYPNICG
ncbi:glycoside hydrolase family 5 protein [Serendipita vermifera MAFF 305830]|uniref:Glycoside hydrolase family 5 protein n=1 Tax=Serendipita vermifera MAFF 305830 TaxID=933852 RepID=A0A0C2X0K2_SERVB|nr:glycoside hydrolase family 5 protein [Serendipita vermifera MAFF 305830]